MLFLFYQLGHLALAELVESRWDGSWSSKVGRYERWKEVVGLRGGELHLPNNEIFKDVTKHFGKA